MADIAKLKILLASPHPVSGAWEVLHVDAAAQGHVVDMEEDIDSLSGNDLFVSTDSTEFAALTDVKKQLWVSWCNDDRNPHNAVNVAFVDFIFGGGSATKTNLAALRVRAVSLWQKEGVGNVRTGTIMEARA